MTNITKAIYHDILTFLDLTGIYSKKCVKWTKTNETC